MAKARSPWRALRPLLLAGAVTAAWLTLSASAATADSSAGSGFILGNVDSSVTSLSAPSAGAVTPPRGAAVDARHQPQGAGSPSSSAGLLQPTVGSHASTAEQLIFAGPVANSAAPASTATAAAVPVAAVVDAAADGLVETIGPPLTEALPILVPVLQPVVDLVDATVLSLPVTSSDLSLDEIVITGDGSTISDATAAPTTATAAPVSAVAEPISHDASSSSSNTSVHLLAATGTSSAPAMSNAEFRSAAPGSPRAGDPSTPPTPGPAGPASGTESGASPSGPSGSAAWVGELGFNLPCRGAFSIGEVCQHAPSPVSFDPGSSPD